MQHVALLVIAKEPLPGAAKTRLCPPCSPQQAATLATAALLDTLAAVALQAPDSRFAQALASIDRSTPVWVDR